MEYRVHSEMVRLMKAWILLISVFQLFGTILEFNASYVKKDAENTQVS